MPVLSSRARLQAIGAALLAVAGLVIVLAYLKPNPFAGTQTVRAVFDDAAGIGVVGADVRMAGTPVGKIIGRERVGDDALITMKLDGDAGPIKRDATAELRPHLAFEGTAFIDLEPGSPSAPALGEAFIPRAHTRNYVALDEALRFARPPVRAALRADVRDLARVLDPATRASLQRTLHGAPALTRDLALGASAALGPGPRSLAGVVRGFADTTAAVAAEEQHLTPLLRRSARTFAALDTERGTPLDRALLALPASLTALDRGGTALRGVIDRLDPLAGELQPGLAALRSTLAVTRPLLREARPALVHARPLVRDLRGALRAGARATPPTRGLLNALAPSLRLLDASLLPALHALTGNGLPAYLAFLNMFEGGGGASRPFQTGAQAATPGAMGAGHFMRFGFRFLTGIGFPAPPCTLLARANQQLADALSAQGACTP